MKLHKNGADHTVMLDLSKIYVNLRETTKSQQGRTRQ